MQNVNWTWVMKVSTVAALGLLVATIAMQVGCGGEEVVSVPPTTEKPGKPAVKVIVKYFPRTCPAPTECPVCQELECAIEEEEVCECDWVQKKCHQLAGSGEEICQVVKHGCKCGIIEREVCRAG